MTGAKWYLIEDINPQPWAIGPLGMGRRNGSSYPYVGPNAQLVAFQKAVKEELDDFTALPFVGDIELEFFIWRRIERYAGRSRTQHSHQADATNIQKALEDALQGVLFPNDRAVQRISTTVVEQSRTTKPRIVIKACEWQGFNPDSLPQMIWNEIDRQPTLTPNANNWGGQVIEGVF